MRGYVIFFTNTPQLVQIYFLYFALPDAGILLSSYAAVLIGMTLNAGAYLTEIQRAGFESVRASEMEAAEVLGFSRLQQIRYVILPHVARVLFPPLSNQYILMTLGTSMAAIFGVEELTGRAFNINSQTFRVDRGLLGDGGTLRGPHAGRDGHARTDRPVRLPRQDEVGLMLDRLLSELPQFFGYYNVVFLAKAALATVALSAVGCGHRPARRAAARARRG